MAKTGGPSQLDKRLAALSAAKRDASAPPPARPSKARKQRSEAREPAYRFATVLINGGFEHKAIVKDFTEHGARIVLEGMHALPPVVTLKIAQTGAKFKAKVVWQREAEAGLALEPGD